MRDSGGVSKIDDREMHSVSPIKKTDELETAVILILPTSKQRFTTVKFIRFHFLSFRQESI
ncbi:hypothetical protein CHCC15337_4424 [Bacillus paralicheniformis]|jgi:hypothetical protein|nr:hypothetical protein CHCC5023_3029 [Bacillus paralicheniformis]TWK53867.1 hypothetical protein CHCC20345_1588 [Bacillus licheniformis]TWJ56539.1 hypothetical protein CHCC5021_2810 [Bacillus paralicheniformis]TWK56278.1 hypothetical protein CHCC20344_3072 [Bacillus licheniformis]TWL06251.1 hypothetical protein CHCC20323_4457 [Bacillus licheniformis]